MERCRGGAAMTDQEWLGWDDFGPLLRFLRRTGCAVSERKLRLLALAYCRASLGPLADPLCWRAAEVGERYADGQAGEAEGATAWQGVA
jgi:hypothetical protein